MSVGPHVFGVNSPEWADMSNYVVHFTKDDGQSPYMNQMGILSRQIIEARNPFGIARHSAPVGASQRAVCFSEVPLHQLSRLAEVRSRYGIGFRKDFLVQAGGNPILYAYRDQGLVNAIRSLMTLAAGNAQSPIWRVTPFVDAPGTYQHSSYFFEWEREWRTLGDLSFTTSDVAFLIIPEDLHEAARAFFEEARQDNTGPCYECPFIDPNWDQDQVAEVIPH
ncbi:MAG: abortive infection system antitoxin AbiGi family protein [Pseudomonadota bacterium]